MKKILPALLLFVLATGCQKNTTPDMQVNNQQAFTRRVCAANDVLLRQLAADPMLRPRLDEIEEQTQDAITSGETFRLVNGAIEIPVVVNLLYKTASENISDAQIRSQIDVLNADYNNTNSDLGKVPSIFRSSIGKVGVRFVLDRTIRKATNVTSWGTDDAMKRSNKGGIDATDPAHFLNMWVCNLADYLGYAQFPGGNPATDGVVILYSAFGSRSIFHQGTYLSDYDLGRTASHEVGHWMNLYHIWGDDGGSCKGSDKVDDTPNQGAENYGCPDFPHYSCNNQGDMSMNYMDYTDDACMFMFTKGQANRMLALFGKKGSRSSFAQ